MNNRKSGHREKWEKQFWLANKMQEKYRKSFYGTICKSSFKIDSHTDNVKVISGITSQRVFVTSNGSKISLSNKNILLSTEDQINRAKTLQAFDCIHSYYSYVSANDDNKKFRQIFSDSTRSRPPKAFLEKGILKTYSKFTREHPYWNVTSKRETFLKNRRFHSPFYSYLTAITL